MEHEAFLDNGRPNLGSEEVRVASSEPSHSNLQRFFYCIFFLKFCSQLSVSILDLPMLRLIEHMICENYIDRSSGQGEEACKTPLIQDKTALIIGYKSTFDALPYLLTAWFYASLANSRGRRFVMLLSNSGQLMAFIWIVYVGFLNNKPTVELLWLSSIAFLVGGGTRMELAMQYSTFCDTVPDRRRTELLSLLHAAAGLAGLVAYPISSALLQHGLSVPFGLASVLFVFKYIALYYIPETSPYLTGRIGGGTSVVGHNDTPLLETNEHARTSQPMSVPKSQSIYMLWCEKLNVHLSALRLREFVGHRGLAIIFGFYFIKRIGFASLAFTSQYASETLHKRLYETFWLRTFHQVGALVVLTLLLPLSIRDKTGPKRDIWVIRGSTASLMIGFFTFWLGRSVITLCLGLAICGLGEGLETGLQALGSFIVGEANHSAFFSLAGMLGVAGELLGGPTMAGLYALRDGSKQPLGACFVVSMLLFGALLACSPLLKAQRLFSQG